MQLENQFGYKDPLTKVQQRSQVYILFFHVQVPYLSMNHSHIMTEESFNKSRLRQS